MAAELTTRELMHFQPYRGFLQSLETRLLTSEIIDYDAGESQTSALHPRQIRKHRSNSRDLILPSPTPSDDELRKPADATALVISQTSFLSSHSLVLSRHSNHRNSQTSPGKNKLTRHRHLPIHSQTQRYRTSRTSQPVPLQR